MRKPHFFLTYLIIFGFLLNFSLSSCTQDDLIANILEDSVSEIPVPTNPGEPTTPTDPNAAKPGDLVINATPCDYTLANIAANATLDIECRLDLGGKTLNLPAGVTLNFKGGEIINGTLNFGAAGKIDGDLLNYKLKVTGNVNLINDVFQLRNERWELVQGKTTSAIAQKNNDNLEDLMEFTKSLGATTFSIGAFDAYFEVSKVTSTTTNQNFYPQKEAVNIPSDFTLLMSENTILRVFPTVGKVSAGLLGIDDVENTVIKGGTLYGDRDIRKYSNGQNAEEGVYLIYIRSGKNISIEGVKLTMGSKGGININSYGFTFNPDYNPTDNVGIRSCTFDKIRMMSIAITDGRNLIIENNEFINSSQPTANSDGGVVGFAMNMEAVRKRDANTGELVLYQKVQDVIIRNNKERGSREGSITIYTGDRITIENNDIENVISWTFATNSKVRNNTFTAPNNPLKPAITAGGAGETVFNNQVSGNTISGYGVGISANHKNVIIFDNKIYNCKTGIQLKVSTDMDVYDNLIKSNVTGSYGISAHIADVNNVKIYNNEVEVLSHPLYFVQLNMLGSSVNNMVSVYKNNFTTSAAPIFSNSRGVIFSENVTKGGLQLSNADKISILDNIIDTKSSHGISLRGVNKNILIEKNNISYPNSGNFECINIASTTALNEVKNINNSCN